MYVPYIYFSLKSSGMRKNYAMFAYMYLQIQLKQILPDTILGSVVMDGLTGIILGAIFGSFLLACINISCYDCKVDISLHYYHTVLKKISSYHLCFQFPAVKSHELPTKNQK